MAIINATAYALFVICIEKSGPLFASQVGYIVTLAGVFWGIVIFNESHSIWVWVSLVTMLIGLMLVSPKKHNQYGLADLVGLAPGDAMMRFKSRATILSGKLI